MGQNSAWTHLQDPTLLNTISKLEHFKSRIDETSSAALKPSSHQLLLMFLDPVSLLGICPSLQIILPPVM